MIVGLGIVGLLAGGGQAEARTPRSAKARAAFMIGHPCPSTGLKEGRCPGWIVDHVKPLACGGADDPANMQWQTREAARAKDRWDRIGCHR